MAQSLAIVSLTVIFMTLIGLTRRQTVIWHDRSKETSPSWLRNFTETLWQYVIAAADASRFPPAYAHAALANALAERGDSAGAIEHYNRAFEINPVNGVAHTNLANALADRGDWEGAMDHYERALQINAINEIAHNGLGNILAARGRFEEAIEHYKRAISIRPQYVKAIENLREALKQKEKVSGG